jgi:ribosomal protein S12 methylthiotransferase accessory factor
MTTRTHIFGKDAALEDTIEKATALLISKGFPIDLVSWINPVQDCWSVHLTSTECPQIYTNGKGASRLAAKASALLEFFERISTNLFFQDYYLGPDTADRDFVFYPTERWFPIKDPETIPTHNPDGKELLNERLRRFYNPTNELTPALLRDNNVDNLDRGISALPFQHLGTDETCYFPVSILGNLYVSNGMAAGNTRAECRAQALSEILERHVKNKIIAGGICLPDVPKAVLERYPNIQKCISELEEHGFPIMIKDASLGGEFPVTCVLLINPENGGCYASFGASCRFEVALERTVTELLQGRKLDQLDVFQPPSHDIEAVADPLNLESHFIDSNGLLSWSMFGDKPDYEFNDWDFEGTTQEEYDRLKSIVEDMGYTAYCAEYPHCGMYTCRIVVPGMSEIYPVDDLVWNNKTTGATLRLKLLKLKQMSVDELKIFIENLDGLGLSDQQPVSDVIGVIFPEDSGWKTLRIGELRAMLALATGDLEEAAQWCYWCYTFNFLPTPSRRLYRAIHDLLEFELNGKKQADYLSMLTRFFGDELVSNALRIASGELTFFGLDFADTWEEISPAHSELLCLYKRLHPLKTV